MKSAVIPNLVHEAVFSSLTSNYEVRDLVLALLISRDDQIGDWRFGD